MRGREAGQMSPSNRPGDWPARLQPRPMARRLANARCAECGCAGDSNLRRLLAGGAGGLLLARVL